MEKKYFDKYRLEELIYSKHMNPNDTIEKYEKYMEEYPQDYAVTPFYVETLIYLRELEKAEKVLDNYSKKVESDDEYHKKRCEERRLLSHANYIYAKLKLLFFQGKYDECYLLACENKKLLKENKSNIDVLLLYLQNEFGIADHNQYGEEYYAFNQLLNYSEERFLNHMKRHLETEEIMLDDIEEKSGAVFYEEFPFEKIFEELKQLIPQVEPYYYGIVNDAYYAKYDFCGRVDEKQVDYFRIIKYHNSDKFITMYPVESGRNFKYIDLNYLCESNNKTKKLNRIEKFNQKYGL